MNASAPGEIDWSLLFFDPAHGLSEKLLARARQRFGDSPDVDAAYNFALERLSAQDWQPLTDGYTGRGSPQGFLAITFINALEYYARAKYPRARPPQWLRRLGDLWLQVWRRLCLKREAVESIVDALGNSDAARCDEVRGAAVQIRARIPNCGQVVAEEAVDPGDETAVSQDALQALDRATAETLLNVAAGMLQSETPTASTEATMTALRDALEMDDDDRLLLKLVYDEGMKVAAAARALGMTRKQASRRHLALLETCRQALASIGLEGEA